MLNGEFILDEFYNRNCIEGMQQIDDGIIDLTITSPPYDGLRDYDGSIVNFWEDFKQIAKELYRITKYGGVVVWVVGDETKDFCESLTSFKQAIYFVEKCKFNLLDTMIYKKKSYPPAYPNLRRYASTFEYMFILCKGKPNTFNPLREDKCKSSIAGNVTSSFRQKDGSLLKRTTDRSKKTKERTNVWEYLTGSHANEDKEKFRHPATFPNKLAEDHILTWTNKGDIVFDPMCGSGTTLLMAKRLGRHYLGFEKAYRYMDIIKKRMAQNLLIKPEVDSSQPLDVKQEGGNGVPPTPKECGYPA